MWELLKTHKMLILQMTKRDITHRFRGSFLGIFWVLVLPLLMLAVYSFVFIYVFEARFGASSAPRGEFALMLFSGIIVHALIADILIRTPKLVLENKNLVTKVIFPLEILPIVTVLSGMVQFGVSLLVLMLGVLLIYGELSWTIVYIPILFLPYLILLTGLGWFLAALGVYIRDIAQISSVIATIFLFVSPVFYDISTLPEGVQYAIYANPITLIVTELRHILMEGAVPALYPLLIYIVISKIIACAGFLFFCKARRGFADIL